MIIAFLFIGLAVALLALMAFSLWLNWRYFGTLESERTKYRQAFYLQCGVDAEWVKSLTEAPKKKSDKQEPIIVQPENAADVMTTLREQWTEQDEYAFEKWRETRFALPVDDAKALIEWYKEHGEKSPLTAFQVT